MNQALSIILLSSITLFIFFGLGRVIQKKFSFLTDSYLVSIPLGFVIYWSLTQIIYMPFIAFQIDISALSIIEILKNVMFILIILVNYDSFISTKRLKSRRVQLSFIGITLSFFALYFITQFSLLGITSSTTVSGLSMSINQKIIETSNSSSISMAISINSVSTNAYSSNSYYFFSSVFLRIFDISLYVFNAWYTTFIYFTVIFFSASFITNYYFKDKTAILCRYILTFLFLIVGYLFVGGTGSLFITPLFIFTWSMYLNHQKYDDDNDRSLIFSSMSLFALSAFTNFSIVLLLVWIFFVIFSSSLTRKSFTRFSAFSLPMLVFASINSTFFFFNSVNYIWIIYLALILLFTILIFAYYVKLTSIWLKIEKSVFDNINTILIFITIISLFVGLIVIIGDTNFYVNSVIIPLFANGYTSQLVALDITTAVINDIIMVTLFALGIYYFKSRKNDSPNRSIAYASFLFILLFFNPVSIAFYSLLFYIQIVNIMSIFYIFFILIVMVGINRVKYKEKSLSNHLNVAMTSTVGAIQTASFTLFITFFSVSVPTMTLMGSEDLNFYIDNYIPDNSYVIGDLYTYIDDGKNIHYDEYTNHFLSSSIDGNSNGVYWSQTWVDNLITNYLDDVAPVGGVYLIKSSSSIKNNSIPNYASECDSHGTDLRVFYIDSSKTLSSCVI